MEKLTLEQAAKEIGVNPKTLHRFEHGKTPDAATLGQILTWALKKTEPR